MALVSVVEYAKLHNRSRFSVNQKIARGGFKTARKIGSFWVVDSDEPYVDERVKTGKYVGWRKSKPEKQNQVSNPE